MEHRWGQRFRLDAPASVTDGAGWTAFARLRDISASGAFLVCTAPHSTVTRVLVRFKSGRANIALSGDVIRRTATGIGIEWYDFAPAAVAPLMQTQARGSEVKRNDRLASTHRGASRGGTLHRDRDRRAPR